MSILNSSTTRQPRPNAIVLNGQPVEELNQFRYLGSEICKDGGSDDDVNCRVRKAKGPLEYCHQFGEIVHFQTALKFAYLKAMSYQFCCMVQALGKSPNQLPPNFKSLSTVASEAFFTFIGPIIILYNFGMHTRNRARPRTYSKLWSA